MAPTAKYLNPREFLKKDWGGVRKVGELWNHAIARESFV